MEWQGSPQRPAPGPPQAPAASAHGGGGAGLGGSPGAATGGPLGIAQQERAGEQRGEGWCSPRCLLGAGRAWVLRAQTQGLGASSEERACPEEPGRAGGSHADGGAAHADGEAAQGPCWTDGVGLKAPGVPGLAGWRAPQGAGCRAAEREPRAARRGPLPTGMGPWDLLALLGMPGVKQGAVPAGPSLSFEKCLPHGCSGTSLSPAALPPAVLGRLLLVLTDISPDTA